MLEWMMRHLPIQAQYLRLHLIHIDENGPIRTYEQSEYVPTNIQDVIHLINMLSQIRSHINNYHLVP